MPTETLGEWEERRGYEKLANDIAGLPEADEPDTVYGEVAVVPKSFIVLLERDYSALRVELRWYEDGEVAVWLRLGEDEPQFTSVPPEKALDAFHHPYAYLPR